MRCYHATTPTVSVSLPTTAAQRGSAAENVYCFRDHLRYTRTSRASRLAFPGAERATDGEGAADGGGEDVAAVRRRRSGDQPGRAPEGTAGVVLMDSLILTSGRLFVAGVVQDLKLQTVSVWQLGGL